MKDKNYLRSPHSFLGQRSNNGGSHLTDYRIEHSNLSTGDRYGRQLVEDVGHRQDRIEKVGLGFDIPPSLVGLRGLQTVGNLRNDEATQVLK
jgi:hypothetical protein